MGVTYKYTQPIVLLRGSGTTTIRFVSVDADGNMSDIQEEVYSLPQDVVGDPITSPTAITNGVLVGMLVGNSIQRLTSLGAGNLVGRLTVDSLYSQTTISAGALTGGLNAASLNTASTLGSGTLIGEKCNSPKAVVKRSICKRVMEGFLN